MSVQIAHLLRDWVFSGKKVSFCVFFAVKVPLDAYMMDFVFSEKEDGGIFDNREGMDYHIPVSGGIAKEPPMHIVHIAVEMAPIAKVILMYNVYDTVLVLNFLGATGFESYIIVKEINSLFFKYISYYN